MCGALHLIPAYDFMVWSGTNLPLPFTTNFKISIKLYENFPIVSGAITCVQRKGLKGQFGKPLSSSWNAPKNCIYLGPEICAVLGYSAAYSGNSSPTFRDNLSVPYFWIT